MTHNRHRKPKIPRSIQTLLWLSSAIVALCVVAWFLTPVDTPFGAGNNTPPRATRVVESPIRTEEKGPGTKSAEVTPTTEPSASTSRGSSVDKGIPNPSKAKCKTA